MHKQPPAPTQAQLDKIALLRAQAALARTRAEESFQRCDTDGFLSQWASTIGAQQDDASIRILENGGCAAFPVLCDAEGNVIADKVYTFQNPHPRGWGFQMSYSFRLSPEDEARYGRRWVPAGSKSRVQKQLGLHEETRWFPAYAKLTTPPGAKSTGLGGCANAYVATFRADTHQER